MLSEQMQRKKYATDELMGAALKKADKDIYDAIYTLSDKKQNQVMLYE